MDILINKDTQAIVKKAELRNLPDFIVITGENGTGKSQFLTYLYVQVPDVTGNHDEFMMDHLRNMYPERGEYVYAEDQEYYQPNVQILDGQRELTNISFRTIQTPTVNIGNHLNVAHLVSTGRKFVHKYIFYIMYKSKYEQNNSPTVDIDALNKAFLEETNYNFNLSSNYNEVPKHFTIEDKSLIDRISAEHNNIDYNLIQYYYIAYLPAPNSTVFSTNIGFLFLQHWARIKIGLEAKESPLEIFNEIANQAKFRYTLQEPIINEDATSIILKMLDRDTKNIVDINDLSSGEKVILSLVLAIYTSNTGGQFPELIIFDEPDAYLHPSLCKFMLDVLQNIFVKDRGIKVIMTTHSPSTVALAPEESLYKMDRTLGFIRKTSQNEAIEFLSDGFLTFEEGIETFKLLKKTRKKVVVCVEGKTDIAHITIAMNKLNRHLDIDLVNLHDAGSLASFIKSIPATILGNKKIIGLFDNDKEGRTNYDKTKGFLVGDFKILTSEQSNGQAFICCLPISDKNLNKYCPIEYLYTKETLANHDMLILRNFMEFKNLFQVEGAGLDEDTKLNEEYKDRNSLRAFKVNDNNKTIFSESANNFSPEDFAGFNPLLDLIEKICNYKN